MMTKFEQARMKHELAAQAHINAANANEARGKDKASRAIADKATANAIEATKAAPSDTAAGAAAVAAKRATTKADRVEAHIKAANAHEAASRVKLNPDHERYERRPGCTASGRSPYDIGDDVAEQLRNLDLEGQYKMVAKVLASEPDAKDEDAQLRDLIERYGDKNPGMQRMNLGNRMRGWLKREEKRQANA